MINKVIELEKYLRKWLGGGGRGRVAWGFRDAIGVI
jgi:hypothetical protein